MGEGPDFVFAECTKKGRRRERENGRKWKFKQPYRDTHIHTTKVARTLEKGPIPCSCSNVLYPFLFGDFFPLLRCVQSTVHTFVIIYYGAP